LHHSINLFHQLDAREQKEKLRDIIEYPIPVLVTIVDIHGSNHDR
jgi:hypothetical protein